MLCLYTLHDYRLYKHSVMYHSVQIKWRMTLLLIRPTLAIDRLNPMIHILTQLIFSLPSSTW